jgi:hypothetical protein
VHLSLNLIVLGSVGLALGLLVVLVLARMASERTPAARREQRRTEYFSINTLTRLGNR